MDAGELNVSLDQKIAGMVKEAGRGLVLVVSKWDTVKNQNGAKRDRISRAIAQEFDFVPWAPLIFTSSISGQNVTKIFELTLDGIKEREKKIKTPELNRWLKKVVNKHTPPGLKNKNPDLKYIVQEGDNESPTFKVFGTQTRSLHWSYKRFMERELRSEFGFEANPIKFWFFDKK